MLRNEEIREIVWTEGRKHKKLSEPTRADDRKSRRFIEPVSTGPEDSEQFERPVWAGSMRLRLPGGQDWARGFLTSL